MKTKTIFPGMQGKFLMMLFIFLGCQTSFAQQTSYTGIGNVETTVIEQVLSVEAAQNLSFGSIFPISTPETVTLTLTSNNPNTAPTVTVSNSNLLVVDNPTAGVWDVLGVRNALVTVTLPDDGTITIDDTGGNSMAVDNFTIRHNSGPSLNLTLDNSGGARFAVGATLSVGANQPAGGYSGTYPITVNYQ